jgi:MFS family permease
LDNVDVSRPTSPTITEWRSGWSVVLGAGAGMGTGVALYIYVSSIFIAPIAEAFGWSRGDLAIGAMLSYVVGAIALPLIGRFTDRFGFRPVAMVCALGLASVYVGVALMPAAYWYYLGLMIVGGVFGGGTASIVWTRPVIATFERQRGLALGLATACTSVAAMVSPLILAGVIGEGGWRAGFFAMAALTGLIGMPLALTLIARGPRASSRPSLHAGKAVQSDDVEAHAARVRDVPLREAVRGLRFWLLVLAIVCINVPGSGVLGQTGRVLTGFALDRFPAPLVGAVTTLVPAIGIVMLMTPELSFPLAALAVGLIGAQQGAEVDLFAYFISRSFGVKHYGALYGVIAMAGALSTAIALVLFGEMHDATGSYDIALVIGAVLFCLGAVAFGVMGRRPPPSVASAPV